MSIGAKVTQPELDKAACRSILDLHKIEKFIPREIRESSRLQKRIAT